MEDPMNMTATVVTVMGGVAGFGPVIWYVRKKLQARATKRQQQRAEEVERLDQLEKDLNELEEVSKQPLSEWRDLELYRICTSALAYLPDTIGYFAHLNVTVGRKDKEKYGKQEVEIRYARCHIKQRRASLEKRKS